eukprot:TRINITY_DN34358_c0_g1_i2.p1 TRINITY_DN34358_c0_g1~~TRINITY_DN34358_c0_g1_i2.p1  ORF type:complete len:567 (+),score=162.23 TRINITY_DN34358_c0_g1_i2:86-1786(+)
MRSGTAARRDAPSVQQRVGRGDGDGRARSASVLAPVSHFTIPGDLICPRRHDLPASPPERSLSRQRSSSAGGGAVEGRCCYRLLLNCEDECHPRRRRTQDVPSCRLSVARLPSAAPAAQGGKRGGAKLKIGDIAQAHYGSVARGCGSTGCTDVLAVVNNHDSLSSSSLSVYDLGRASESPVVTIAVAGLVQCHAISGQGDLACGLASGEALVYSVTAACFTARLPSPWRDRPHRQGKAIDAEAATCCAWAPTQRGDSAADHLYVGHQHGCLYRYSPSPTATIEPLTTEGFVWRGAGAPVIKRQVKRGANPQLAVWLTTSALLALSITADGTSLAAASRDGWCYVVDLHNPRLRARFETGCGACLRCAWSPCGTLLAAGGQDDAVFLYSVSNPAPLARLYGLHNWPAEVAVLAPRADGRATVAAAGEDGRLVLWDAPCGGTGSAAAPDASTTLSPSAISPAQVLVSDSPSSPARAPPCELVGTDEGGVAVVRAPRWATRHLLPVVDPASVLERLHGGSPLAGVALLGCGAVVTSCSHGSLRLWAQLHPQQEQGEPTRAAPHSHPVPR